MIQKTKQPEWQDETGKMIPLKYISPLSRIKERAAASLLTNAKKLNENLTEFKTSVKNLCNDVYAKAQEELKTQNISKGNFTFFYIL